MKKIFFVLICTMALFLSANFEMQVHAQQGKYFVTEEVEADEKNSLNALISRWWYEAGPVPYQGRTMYITTSRFGQCLHGHIAARNIGGGLFMYEGYLFPCNGPLPMPSKKPVEEDNE